jgi:hypothetical protein
MTSKLAIFVNRLNVEAAKEMVLGGMLSPVLAKKIQKDRRGFHKF